MPQRTLTTLALALALTACGGPPTRDCPAPIGPIVLEDCEIYQRRFEALRVDVDVLLGGTGARVGVARRSLRTRAKHGEALDVLSHRLFTMCRDHNACRVPDRGERAALDQTVVALTTLRDRIEDEPDPEARAVLVAELRATLLRAAGTPSAAPRAHYKSWLPWFGAVHRPPQPDPPVGVPVIGGVDLDTQARFASGRGIVGWAPSARIDLWWPGEGGFAEDDALLIAWEGGHVSACPVRGRGNGADHRSVTCNGGDEMVVSGEAVRGAVRYRTGVDGREHALGEVVVRTVAHPVDGPDRAPSRDVDLDPRAAQGELVWRPHDGALPVSVDQPSLWVVLKLRDHARPTARCRIGDDDLFGVLKPSRYSGQEGTHQDRPRYRRVAPGKSVGEAQPFTEWWRFDFPLPLGVARPGHDLPEGLAQWPRVGAWRCTVTLDGEPVRRLAFVVQGDGSLAPHPEQTEAHRAGWLLDTEVVPSSVEEPLGW